ncbi:glycogen debranching protein [Bifidobacterium dolichotidis]|uniref:Glycogen debranching protein n=1 Tax=Bifidobacterium dolichotidis TaxID=2306976 RepID=A0A430FQA0_9BIFI|nr:alpha-amylase family glycosyl hydrolase [Bifidobacterium dolichotidis]RSX54985.1 glycogen debranching protein [Bifidobacterium dolichotidis]
MHTQKLHRYATRPGIFFTDDGGADIVVRSETAEAMWLSVVEPQDQPSQFYTNAIKIPDDADVPFVKTMRRHPIVTRCVDGHSKRETLFRMEGPNYGLWYVHLPKAWNGMHYGFRADGVWDPKRGLMFNPYKFLLDPYAKGIDGVTQLDPAAFSYACTIENGHVIGDSRGEMSKLDSLGKVPYSVAIDDRYDADYEQDPAHPHVHWRRTVIYELHVKGFTANAPWLPPELRGTYAGLAHPKTLSYLQELGVTSIELMPIHAKQPELFLQERNKPNYWGYSTLGYFAPEPSYATKKAQQEGAMAVRREVIDMVKALHQAGFEVIMDVVFNHSCEGGNADMTVCWRGLDNLSYYRQGEPGQLIDTTGCGNTFDFTDTRNVVYAVDSLKYWAKRIGIDGFRFDLAVATARLNGEFTPFHPFLYALRSDKLLGNLKLIMEPWDIGPNGWRTGQFLTPFSEWNDRFRDTARSFWITDVAAQEPPKYKHLQPKPDADADDLNLNLGSGHIDADLQAGLRRVLGRANPEQAAREEYDPTATDAHLRHLAIMGNTDGPKPVSEAWSYSEDRASRPHLVQAAQSARVARLQQIIEQRDHDADQTAAADQDTNADQQASIEQASTQQKADAQQQAGSQQSSHGQQNTDNDADAKTQQPEVIFHLGDRHSDSISMITHEATHPLSAHINTSNSNFKDRRIRKSEYAPVSAKDAARVAAYGHGVPNGPLHGQVSPKASVSLQEMATRLCGSADLFATNPGRGATSSINFVTAHDGFTLADLVSYKNKHNEANGEHNTDGSNSNHSANFGVEGPSDDPQIQAARERAIMNVLGMLMLSLGTPMMLAGDEFGNSQQGNNNAYCLDDETTWLDWSWLQKPQDSPEQRRMRSVSDLIAIRKMLDIYHHEDFFTRLSQLGFDKHSKSRVMWFLPDGSSPQRDDWQDKSLHAFTMRLTSGDERSVAIVVNSGPNDLEFHLPADCTWHLLWSSAQIHGDGPRQDSFITTHWSIPANSISLLGSSADPRSMPTPISN